MRAIKKNPTVLSGDIDSDDENFPDDGIDAETAAIHGENSYHVVRMDGDGGVPITESTVLDGFTITGGDANDTAGLDGESGGGIYCSGQGLLGACSPSLANLMVIGNLATMSGGGLFNDGTFGGVSNPILNNVIFRGNTSFDGGAIYNSGFGGTSSPVLENILLDHNSAQEYGGAIFNNGLAGYSSPSIVNTTLTENEASSGGAIYNYATGGQSSPRFVNVTFHHNTATFYGGAVCNIGYSGTSLPSFINAIFWNDTAAGDGPEIYNDDATATLDHAIVDGVCPHGTVCVNTSSFDPLISSLSDHGGFSWTLLPAADSPAIGTGDFTACPSTDQRGFPRDAHCDIGAVERQPFEDIIFRDGFQL